MSYILDALRKADAERERGHVPGIHAQPSFAGPAPVGVPRRSLTGAWIGAVGALALALLVALGWYAFGGGRGGATVAVVTAAPPAAPAPLAGTAAAPSPAPAPAPLPAPAAVTAALPMTVPPPPARPKPEAVPRAPRAATATAKAEPKPEAGSATIAAEARPGARAGTAAAAPSGAASTAARVYAVAELPDDIRRALPAVNVGGSMYSGVPANRLLIVNGQVLHEGDRIAPELTLQQIKLKGAVLAFRGWRYEIAY